MPTQKDIVTGVVTAEQWSEHIIEKTIEKYKPYKSHKVKGGYTITYDSPSTMVRSLVMSSIADKATAKDIVGMLERSWALGFISSRSLNRTL